MLIRLFLIFYLSLVCNFATAPAAKAAQEPLFYTIQIATYDKIDDALPLYRLLQSKLPKANQSFLRIAKVSGFITIRLGKENSHDDLLDTLERVRKIVPDVHIMHAYYRIARILYPIASSTGKADFSTPIPSKPPQQKPAPPSKKSISNEKLMAPPPPAVIVSKPKPRPDSKEFLTAMMNKYLTEDKLVLNKGRQYAKQAAKNIPASTGCLAADCHAKLLAVKKPHSPVQEAKCVACHKQTSQEHPSGKKNDFSLLSPEEPLCLKCHQNVTNNKIIHSPVAEGNCLACHNPHGTDNKNLLSVSENNQKKLCIKCHDAKNLIDFKFMHGPVDIGACTFCHNPHSSSEASLLRQPSQKLCLTCHKALGSDMGTMPDIHSPVKLQGCLACHLPHGSKFSKLLKEDGEDSCLKCHADIKDKLEHSRTKHAGLYLEKQCQTCHTAHFSKYNKLLIKPEKDLCLSCHRGNSPVSGFRPKDIVDELKNKEYLHGPITAGKCSGCHDPHGSDYSSLLTGAIPASFYAPYTGTDEYGLCFKCHKKGLLSEAQTTDSTNFRNGKRNLHYVHVAKENKGRTCKSCHQSHASNGPKLISKMGAQFGTWHISTDFKLTDSGGSCTPSCHREMKYDRQKPKNNSAGNHKYGKYYVDYKSNQ